MSRLSKLSIRNVGPLLHADIEFGDLTVLVGPQASGKSIALQWLKLLNDTGAIKAQLLDYGIDWARSEQDFLNIYFGEGMSSIWQSKKSELLWNGEPVDFGQLVRRKATSGVETTFLIPAQRVLTLRDGWPRPFGDYGAGDPYSVRAFSEKLRILMETEFKIGVPLFPRPNRLKVEYRDMLSKSIFGGYSLTMTRAHAQKRLVLHRADSNLPFTDLPFMVWSAGQREFVPLLLGLYWLIPSAKIAVRGKIKWVIIEELEMGLHPRAIATVLSLILELLARGYKVCLSSHSPQVLEFVWAWQIIRETPGSKPVQLLNLLGSRHSQSLRDVAATVIKKQCKVYFFENGRPTVDITSLDPAASDGVEASWGGLLEFAGRANEVVAQAVANASLKQAVRAEVSDSE